MLACQDPWHVPTSHLAGGRRRGKAGAILGQRHFPERFSPSGASGPAPGCSRTRSPILRCSTSGVVVEDTYAAGERPTAAGDVAQTSSTFSRTGIAIWALPEYQWTAGRRTRRQRPQSVFLGTPDCLTCGRNRHRHLTGRSPLNDTAGGLRTDSRNSDRPVLHADSESVLKGD